MPREFDFLGALVPGLLPVFLLSAVVHIGLDWACGHYGVYRYVWHRSLFRICMLICVFGLLNALLIK
ncbi:MAG: DUF1656 domain-containing protein [Rhodocyclaceae bacterium]|nr:DUF1656 domain-containing protein [Rhodocyclaceae bacterium]